MRNVQDIMVLAPGDILFQQGDPGGDLFFIQKGEIEIFTTKENIDVVLTVMKAGEVLGLMTFASTEPRMAGARAKSETVLKRVSKEQIAGQISAMPSWLKIVLKDLKFRITQMNAKYSASLERIRDLKKSQISNLISLHGKTTLWPCGCIRSKNVDLSRRQEICSRRRT